MGIKLILFNSFALFFRINQVNNISKQINFTRCNFNIQFMKENIHKYVIFL